MDINDEIHELHAKSVELKNKIIAIIDKFPDNPNIERISGNSEAFTIKMSQLSDWLVLSPEYYDWKYQYKKIIIKIEEMDILTFDETFNKILKDKRFKLNSNVIYLCPEVINKLKEIL